MALPRGLRLPRKSPPRLRGVLWSDRGRAPECKKPVFFNSASSLPLALHSATREAFEAPGAPRSLPSRWPRL